MAGRELRQAMARTAAEQFDAPPDRIRFEEGLVGYEDRSVEVGQVVRWMRSQGLQPRTLYEYWAPTTQALGTGGDMHFAFSYATQAALVEVDLETCAVTGPKVVAGP